LALILSLDQSDNRRVKGATMSTLAKRATEILTRLPDAVLNHLPVLGRICVRGPGGRPLYMRTYGKAGKDRIALKLWRDGLAGYEPETLQVFLALLDSTRLFVDIGANTGLFSLVAALEPHRNVIAFEPVPPIFEVLQTNVRLNGLTNLTAERLAVSDEGGEISFYVTQTRGGIPTDCSSVAGFRANTEACPLTAVTLDGYLAANELGPVDLIKIDVEAAEPRVLRGAKKTLERDRPLIVCEVLEEVDRDAIHGIMDPMDYHYFHLTPDGLARHERLNGNLGRGYRNYLFVPRECSDDIRRRCARFGMPGMKAAA
jgi:FkbM family methyltransferase